MAPVILVVYPVGHGKQLLVFAKIPFIGDANDDSTPKVFRGHGSHLDGEEISIIDPTGQSMEHPCDAPGADRCPAGHGVQAVKPYALPNVPAGHGEQVVLPYPEEYVPG